MEKEDKALISKLTDSSSLSKNYLLSVNYICNPDGTIRWMYPSRSKKPTFLKFYSSSTLKSKMFSLITSFLFNLKVFNILFSNKISLLIQEGSFLDQLNKSYHRSEYSIFFGTVGINRKLIFYINKDNQESTFIKLAVSKDSILLIKNEALFLDKISTLPIENTFFPKLIGYPRTDAIELTDIKPHKSFQPSKIDKLHINTVININSINQDVFKWIELPFFYNLDDSLKNLSNKESKNNIIKTEFINSYIQNARLALNFIETDKDVLCGLSHGDFTPWNMYKNTKNQLFIYDWELAKINIPLFFDLFHFIFQSNILLSNSKFHVFKNELIEVKNDQTLKAFIDKNTINIDENYIFYIVYISSYYLDIYLQQENIHKQAIWQLECWHQALLDVIKHNGMLLNE